eukprot:TRINITY_DN1465_c0_g1_i21.p1 TRINITY_DN1465_c0_g1~~TRINITY_DN1465_c0_g1_i21.p1  ORF type:complete len:135 (-),score=18.29 TRINITY_DN1465_c0_g1_i21:212-616(-)
MRTSILSSKSYNSKTDMFFLNEHAHSNCTELDKEALMYRELLNEKFIEIESLKLKCCDGEKRVEKEYVRSSGEISKLQNELKMRCEEVNQLKYELSSLRRDFDQKLQQSRTKYEEQLLMLTVSMKEKTEISKRK